MNHNEFRNWSQRAVEWGVDYRETLRDLPVRAQTKPGAIFNALPREAPEAPEPMETIFSDFERIILPGMQEEISHPSQRGNAFGRRAGGDGILEFGND